MSMFGLNLADFADARRAVVANPALLPDAMEESLRYNTSAQRFRRCLTQDVELHGQQMRAGDFVCLAYGSGNRDDRQYPNADVYDLARKPRGHLGFGGSVHACLGATIARLSLDDRDGRVPQGRPRVPSRRGQPAVDAVVDLPQPDAAVARGGVTAQREASQARTRSAAIAPERAEPSRQSGRPVCT